MIDDSAARRRWRWLRPRRSGGGGWDFRSDEGRWRPARPHRAGRRAAAAQAARRRPRRQRRVAAADDAAAPRSDGTCSSDLEQIVCGATNDVQDYWPADLPRSFGVPYEDTKTVFFTDATDTGCGQARRRPGRSTAPSTPGVHRPGLHAAARGPVRRRTDLAEQYIVAHEYGHHIQNLSASTTRCSRLSARPGPRQPVLGGPRAAGRLLRRGVGGRRRRRAACSTAPTRSTRRSTPPRASATTASSRRRRAASTRRAGRTDPPSSARRGSTRATTPATRASATRSPRSRPPHHRPEAERFPRSVRH